MRFWYYYTHSEHSFTCSTENYFNPLFCCWCCEPNHLLSQVWVCELCLTVVRYSEGVLAFSPLSPAAHRGESPVLVSCRVSVCKTKGWKTFTWLLLIDFCSHNKTDVTLHLYQLNHGLLKNDCTRFWVHVCVYLSTVRRAPTSDVILLGQSNSIFKSPRHGWVMVTVTATCSSVFIPDGLRSSAETEGEERAAQWTFICKSDILASTLDKWKCKYHREMGYRMWKMYQCVCKVDQVHKTF